MVFAATLPEEFDEAAPPSPYSAHYQINECASCTLLYSSPIMEDAGIAGLYRESSETNVVPGEEDNVRRTMAGYYRLGADELPARNRMLDVGCDMGFLLEVARRDGFTEVHGIEPNPVARAKASMIPGASIVSEFYENKDYPPAHFDLITLIHVLDHLVDPRIVLTRALGHLRPGGILIAVVHNVDSLLGRLLGERFPVFNLYHHFFFNKKTLAKLLQSQGYGVVRTVSTRNCYSLGFLASRLPGCPESIRGIASRTLRTAGVAEMPLNIRLGNIGIVARRAAA